ncbi:WhiB family transcription factor [Gordonia phage Skysand]|uniref:WhiB family transcription factor n=1 Tax=Gordonia phage Skysand TaxID=2301559 RepID=A0A385DU82_9CAUD|nr:transcriptional regulator WhiB-like [Gordonia phage Skysand]AXQ62109.1 WhiB family transcription factor [Gordonia phage Skysand]
MIRSHRTAVYFQGTNVITAARVTTFGEVGPKPNAGPPRAASMFDVPDLPREHENWMADAACGGLGDSFVPNLEARRAASPEERIELRQEDEMARRICVQHCPVAALCARHALETAQSISRLNGIWAGVTFSGVEHRGPYITKLERLFEVMHNGEIQWEPSSSKPTTQPSPSESLPSETDSSGPSLPMTTLPSPPSRSGGPLVRTDTIDSVSA